MRHHRLVERIVVTAWAVATIVIIFVGAAFVGYLFRGDGK